MSTNDDLLQKLRKLLSEAADTTDHRSPWQELFGRESSVPSRAIRAAEAVRGFAGSWAASYSISDGHTPNDSGDTTPTSGFDYQLGKRGYPEINFVPYNWNTNRFGNKGPSLVGHPVSFEVVGPTHKRIVPEGAGTDFFFAVDLYKNRIQAPTLINTLYGIDSLDDLDAPLWLMITELGGAVEDVHTDYPRPYTSMYGLRETPKHARTARYELFRVDSIRDNTFSLEHTKRLDEYFYGFAEDGDDSGVPKAKSIMLLQPKVARLAPVLDSDNRTYIVVPPERAAVGEYQDSHQEWIARNGYDKDYNVGNLTPIPKPLPIQNKQHPDFATTNGEFKAEMNSVDHPLGATGLGRFRVFVKPDSGIDEVFEKYGGNGLILHVSEVAHKNTSGQPVTSEESLQLNRFNDNFTGYFEIIGHEFSSGQFMIECRETATIDVPSGRRKLQIPSGFEMPSGRSMELRCTLHLPVRSLFANKMDRTYADDLEAARITGLIDPNEVGRSLKVHGTNDVPGGGYSGRADRTIPSTQRFTDPGSLLDLGFRMVLFTGTHNAKTNKHVVDWENPIASNEAILDPSITEESQYIDIDYASGLVKFSHTPARGGDFNLDEDDRAIVFASFIPYSMEGGQRSVGVRMTGGDLHSANLGYPQSVQRDVFANEVFFEPVGSISVPWGGQLKLRATPGSRDLLKIPNAGSFAVSKKKAGFGGGSLPYVDTQVVDPVDFTYDGAVFTSDEVLLLNVRSPSNFPAAFNFTSDHGVLFRRRADLKSLYDRNYGASARSDVVRLAYGDVTYNEDGSMVVMPTAVAGPAEELRAFFPLGNLIGDRTEIGRFHLDRNTQRWSTDDPPWYRTGHEKPPQQLNEIGVEVSRGRLYTNWEFSPKSPVSVRHVWGLITEFNLSISSGSITKPMREYFSVAIPKNLSREIDLSRNFSASTAKLLSARIEGATIRTKTLGSTAKEVESISIADPNEQQVFRYVFGIDESAPLSNLNNREKPPSAGCHKLKVVKIDPASTETIKDLVGLMPGSEIAFTPDGAQFAISGRQIFAFPEKPYLASAPIDFSSPIEWTSTLRAIMDLRTVTSTDRTTGAPDTWLHTELVLEHPNPSVPKILNSVDEMALYFNEISLYSQRMLREFEGANFNQLGNTNLDIQNIIGEEEHCLAWVGPKDPRYPSSLDGTQIALIYTGNGGTKKGGTSNEYLYPHHIDGIICELHTSNNDLKANNDLLKALGGSFKPDSNPKKPQARFGGINIIKETDLDLGVNCAYGNTHLGFRERGTRPLGRLLGSFKIKAAGFSQTGDTELKVYYPTGGSSDWYNDQSVSGVADNASGHKAEAKHQWLGRHSWPLVEPDIVNVGQDAGLTDVYVTFGADQFNESYDRNNPLHLPYAKINPSMLLEIGISRTEAEEWDRPQNVWESMSFGDLVNIDHKSGNTRSDGRILHKTREVSSFSVLCGVKDGVTYDNIVSGRIDSGIPRYYDNTPIRLFKPTGYMPKVAAFVSITPSNISGVDAAVGHFTHSKGLTKRDEFLSGYATDVRSSVLIGSGRVSMLSALAELEPTGIALHNLISAAPWSPKDSLNKSSVYIESGAFTTFIGGGDHRGFWQSLEDSAQVKKMPDYPSIHPKKRLDVGGVGGVRISGDAHLWLDNIQRLASDKNTAFISEESLFQHPVMGTMNLPSGHLPHKMTTLVPGTGLIVQEATIEIGLTQADFQAIKTFTGVGVGFDIKGDSIWTMGAGDHPFNLGARLFQMGQMAVASSQPLFMPSLVGSYIGLSTWEQVRGGAPTQRPHSNQGMWRIVAAPVVLRRSVEVSTENTPLSAFLTDAGRQREAQIVAVMSLRVEGFRVLNDDEFEGSTVVPEDPFADLEAYYWGVYRDSDGKNAIYTGDVVDPGGSPTGAPASLRGLTFDPHLVAGKSSLSAEIVAIGPGYFPIDSSPSTFSRSGVELLGVHDQVARFGKHFSRAFFAAPIETDGRNTLPTQARMVVLADEAGLVDGFPRQEFNGEISVDGKTGRVDYLGYPRRLGPGVIMDGGLGMVQANAFRARPRPSHVEHLGKMMVWGRGAYPLHNNLTRGNVGTELPSVFNTTEFHGEISVANPMGRIVFESPRAAEGVAANMLAAEFLTSRHRGPSHLSHYLGDTFLAEGLAGPTFTETPANFVEQLQQGVVVSDTIFPHVSSGVVYRTPGTTVYERAFRSLDSTGSNPHRKSNDGSHNRGGIPGMGIPFKGEVLLLPQGPTCFAQHRQLSKTPVDRPLYDFINGPPVSQMVAKEEVPLTSFHISNFGINVLDIVGGLTNVAPANALIGVPNHYSQMGTISQAYRHSNSRQDPSAFFKNLAVNQVRVLDGMVIEDTTNGTFYTVGSIGRDKWLASGASAGLGMPGDGRRSPVNGSIVAAGTKVIADVTPVDGQIYERFSLPELIYDLGQHYDPNAGAIGHPTNGFGDRVDAGVVRRPLTGHRFRVTPNVEFVPVLGERGVSGGLLPPMYWIANSGKDGGFSARSHTEADALFYDLNQVFKEDDIGKMLYICGTEDYVNTGWWVIIDTISPVIEPLYAHPEAQASVPSFAALRKFNWGERHKSSPIPLSSKTEVTVQSTGDFNSNVSDNFGHFSTPDTEPSYDDLHIILTSDDGDRKYAVIGKNDMLGSVWTAADAAAFLNADERSNGQELLWKFANEAGTPADYPVCIRWFDRAESLQARFSTAGLPMAQRQYFNGGATTFQVYWRTRIVQAGGTDQVVYSGEYFVGFGYHKGHNLGAVRMVGDGNNSLPVQYVCPPIKFDGYRETPARGLRWVFSHPLTEENVGSYVHLTKPHVYRFSSPLPTQEAYQSEFEYDGKWLSGVPRKDDVLKKVDLSTDIFRINRCPTTAKMVLGGDCEVFHPEFNTFPEDATKGRKVIAPIMYSPLGVQGNWQDTDTGMLPDTGSLNFPPTYALQPIAREKIVTLSPTNAKSSVVFSRGLSDKEGIPQGPQGVGPGTANGNATPASPTASFFMEPFQLVGRADMTRTSMAQSALWNFDSRTELNNANLAKAPVTFFIEEAKTELAKCQSKKDKYNDEALALDAELVTLGAIRNKLLMELIKVAQAYANTLTDIQNLYATPQGQLALEQTKKVVEMQMDWPKLEEIIKRYVIELEVYEHELAQLTKALEEAEHRIAELMAQKADIETQYDWIMNELAHSYDKLAKFLSQESDVQNEVAMLRDEILKYINQLSQYDANLDYEADYEGDDPIVRDLVKAIRNHEHKIADLMVVLHQIATEIAAIKAYIAKCEEQKFSTEAAMEEILASLEAAHLHAEKTKKEMEVHVDTYEGDYSDALATKLKSYDWWDIIPDFVENWEVSYGLKLRFTVFEYWYNTAPAQIKAEVALEEKYNDATGLTPLLNQADAEEAALFKVLDALTENTEEAQEVRDQKFFAIKGRDYHASKEPFLTEIFEYWVEAMEVSQLGSKLEIAAPSTYMWTPAGEWWQLYQPAWDQHGPDASAPPPTLRIDLTDSFTQAVGPGSGLNTPYPNRFPRGVRLNRLWVNFGVWGNDITGTDSMGVPSRKAFNTPGFPEGLETGAMVKDLVLDQMYMSFNLIVEIPGSLARTMNSGYTTDPASGSAGFPMGGRMPNATTTHRDNSNGQIYPGGTIVIPLYVNREAGDLMPNVMERFVTVGPKNDINEVPFRAKDWSGGDYRYGFGCTSARADDPSFYRFDQAQMTIQTGDISDQAPQTMFVNSFNPVIWGGMDFAPAGHTENDGVFASARFARVQSSVFPRSSSMGGGLRSAFTSGLVPDGEVFSTIDPHSLSAATLTGITVAHSGLLPELPRVVDGSYTAYNRNAGNTCSHGFTIALTPVGDAHTVWVEAGDNRVPLDPHGYPVNANNKYNTAHYGRELNNPVDIHTGDEDRSLFKVGNWLEQIAEAYGIYVPSGSMLPPGARVFLEVAVGPGPAAKDQDPEGFVGAGAWVGNVKLSFDVETVDGTAWTQDVNVLGDEEG